MIIDPSKRTWNTSVRSPWNARIFHILKSIDAHNELYFRTLDDWHLEQASYLRHYLNSLKTWIKDQESDR
jgi:hypothetical protein